MACVDFLFHYLGVSLMPLSERERERERDTTTTTTTTTEIEIESKKECGQTVVAQMVKLSHNKSSCVNFYILQLDLGEVAYKVRFKPACMNQ